MEDGLWKSVLVEFLGTLTLVLIAAGAVALTSAQGSSLVGSALTYGFIFAALFFAWGTYSGGHFNPATSFGYAVAGRMNWGLMLVYWIAQLLGGIAGAALIVWFYGSASGVGATVGSLTKTQGWKALILEAIITFILVIAVLLVTKNPMYAIISGLAIGIILTANYLAVAPLTGASMNPARSLGPAIFSSNMGTIWIYLVGPLIGALVAGLVFRLFNTNWNAKLKTDDCGNPVLDECGNKVYQTCHPKLDRCGNPVTNDCGEVQMEYRDYYPRSLGYKQETWGHAIGDWMNAHGMNPNWLMDQAKTMQTA